MDGQELYNLYEAYMKVYMDEGYKELPADKMARQALKKNLDAIKTSIKTRFTTAPESTARNVDVAKAKKKLSQAKKIMNVRDKTHVPAEVKTKEAKNRGTDYLSLVRSKYMEQTDLYDTILSHLLDEENMEKSPRNAAKIKKKAQDRKNRRARIQYYGKDAVGHGTGEHLTPTQRKDIQDEVDLYDIILSHLLDEGYAETLEAAKAMMVNMSEQWRDSIIG